MVYVREGFIAKQIKNLETKNVEIVNLEFTTVKEKWCILFDYRPPKKLIKKNIFMKFQLTLIKHLVNMLILFMQVF